MPIANKPVLFAIDDDPEVLRAVERDLRRKYARGRNGGGYRALRADSAAAALDTLGKLKLRGDPAALFLVDQRMPQTTGVEGVGEGTGLRLDIVRRIVAGHGGEIRVDSIPGKTSFKVRLPIDRPRRESSSDGNGG